MVTLQSYISVLKTTPAFWDGGDSSSCIPAPSFRELHRRFSGTLYSLLLHEIEYDVKQFWREHLVKPSMCLEARYRGKSGSKENTTSNEGKYHIATLKEKQPDGTWGPPLRLIVYVEAAGPIPDEASAKQKAGALEGWKI